VQTALGLKMTPFWVIVPCRAEVDRRFRGGYCFHHQGDENRHAKNWVEITNWLDKRIFAGPIGKGVTMRRGKTAWEPVREGGWPQPGQGARNVISDMEEESKGPGPF
jgi:hypothetical protein